MKNRVRIIAPASMYAEHSHEKLATMKEFLESSGFIVTVQEEIFADPPIPFYANIKEKRLIGLKQSIQDPDIDILWAFRGGYGCGEIVEDCLDISPVGTKILIGFSDITILHVLFNQHYKIPSIHGDIIGGIANNPEKTQEIFDILGGKKQTIILTPQNKAAAVDNITGILSGGNLTTLSTLLGTKLHPDMQGKIIVLEDILEPGYKIARTLNHLEKAGIFNGAVACIFGDFTNCSQNFDIAIKNFIDAHPELPIFKTEGIGHGEMNHPLVFGSCATITGEILECSPII